MLSIQGGTASHLIRAFLLFGVLAPVARTPVQLFASDAPVEAGVEAGDDEPTGSEPAPVPPGERPFWEAILLLSSDDAEKQRRGRDKLLEAADLEYVPAQTYLGECYLRGQDGFTRNERRAASWFRLAADRGDAAAQVYLGTCYMLGKGVSKDRSRARAALMQAAAGAGSYTPPVPPSWFLEERARLGEAEGAATRAPRDGPVAMTTGATPWEYLLARGHFMLGLIHEEERNLTAALASFETATHWGVGGRAGIADAAARAARFHALGRGCTRDLVRANELLERSRELRRSGDMAFLHSLWTNRRVDDFLLADLEKQSSAQADAHLVADQQDVAAALRRENPAEALRWCEFAAEAGEVWAMIELADILRTGGAGTVDTAGAFAWYVKADEAGRSWVALANLLVCHRQGIGTAVDQAAADAILRRHGEDNFAVALAAAGHVPQASWTAAGWLALLDHQARVARLPIARYFKAMGDYERLIAAGDARIDVKPRDVIKEMRRAAAEGIRGAHYFLADMMRRGWDGTGTKEKYETALQTGADLGHLHAMVNYAIILADREGNANLRRAIELNREVLRRDPDNANAHNNLAVDLEAFARKGLPLDGIPDLRAEAIRHYERAEELGSAVAAKNLAVRYYNGTGVERDVRMAYTYYLNAAEKGDTEANRILGRMHERGEGVPVTPREAMYYYRIAALDGDVQSLKAVCDFYLSGQGVERDLEAAKHWLIRLAGTGDVVAVLTFGDVLIRQKRYDESFKFWRGFRESPNPVLRAAAHERLSRHYRDGLGVKSDARRAERHFRTALDMGNAEAICRHARDLIVAGRALEAVTILERVRDVTGEAQFLLGSVRVAGQGVPQDVAKGLEHYRTAARLGHLDAKYMLAVATLKKLPGAPTLDEAARLLEEAEAGGFTKAAELRPTVEARRARAADAPKGTGRAGSG